MKFRNSLNAPGLVPCLLAVGMVGCNSSDSPSGVTATTESNRGAPNILVLIADDAGVEQFSSFGIGSAPASTPHLDALAARGMQFSNVWAQPMCSPTRATLLAGRYAFRTGVGYATAGAGVGGDYPERPEPLAGALPELQENLVQVREISARIRPVDTPASSYGLRRDEVGLPAVLRETAGHATAAIGKWHLADTRNGWLEHPGNVGFEHYSVTMRNQPESYFSWWENVNGVMEHRTGYTPRRKVDDAITWIAQQEDRPWFLWLAFSLPHYPHHLPAVNGIDTPGNAADDQRATLDVMLARLDEEIGRLLASIGEDVFDNTVVVFVGDNGTTGESIDPPFHPDRGKFTLYEGGLRVPLVFAGPGVPSGVSSDALVNTTDVYATIIELAGASVPADRPLDSVSLVPYFANPGLESIRTYQLAEYFHSEYGASAGEYAIGDGNHKLIGKRAGRELYDLGADLSESNDLLADGISAGEQEIVDRLEATVEELRRSE
ncbi:MAG: sulfatase-like hydrolase/transferase [Rhodospirillaceae bacterium]|nr:sulfatase-like hydrolase/transferase [Rhodospirillaceae bacterium]